MVLLTNARGSFVLYSNLLCARLALVTMSRSLTLSEPAFSLEDRMMPASKHLEFSYLVLNLILLLLFV